MKRILLSVFIILIAVSMPIITALAQDGTQSYTSPDGFTLEYPADWSVTSVDGGYIFASSAELAEEGLPPFLPSAEMLMAVLPPSLLLEFDLDENEDPQSAVDLVSSFVINEPGETVETEFNGQSAVYQTGANASAEYVVLAIAFDEGTIVGIGMTAVDELANALPIYLAIVETLTYATPEPVDAGSLETITADNASNLREVLDLSSDDYNVYNAVASPNGGLVAIEYYSYAENPTSEYELVVIDVAAGEVMLTAASAGYFDLAFTADGSHLVYAYSEYDDETYDLIGNYQGSIDVATGENTETEIDGFSQYFDVNGDTVELIATLEDESSIAHITANNPENGEIAVEFDLDMQGIYSVFDFSPDFSTLLVSSETSIQLVDITTGEWSDALYTSTAEYPEFDTAAFSPDGTLVVFAENSPYSIFVVDIASGETVFTLDRSNVGDTLDLATFSPDGSVLFVAERAGLLVIDVATGEILTEMPQIVDGNLEDFNISTDGRVLIGAGYESVMIWGVPAE